MTPSPTPDPSEQSARDFPEDVAPGRGLYLCSCLDCGERFHGSKYRKTCKLCAATPQPSPQNEPVTDGKWFVTRNQTAFSRYWCIWQWGRNKAIARTESDTIEEERIVDEIVSAHNKIAKDGTRIAELEKALTGILHPDRLPGYSNFPMAQSGLIVMKGSVEFAESVLSKSAPSSASDGRKET